jgi:hypothetical protein
VTPKKASDNRRGPGSDRAWSLYLIREPRVHSNDKQRRRCERRLNLRSKCHAFAAREQRWQANRPADARGEACGFGAPLNHLIGGRLARRCAKTAPARSLPPKNGDQRLGRASLTRGNVAGSHTPGNITPETRLPGWGTGFEPRLTESESAILPLNYAPPDSSNCRNQKYEAISGGFVAGAGGFEPPHGGIKIRTFLTKNNGLHVYDSGNPVSWYQRLTRFLSNL